MQLSEPDMAIIQFLSNVHRYINIDTLPLIQTFLLLVILTLIWKRVRKSPLKEKDTNEENQTVARLKAAGKILQPVVMNIIKLEPLQKYIDSTPQNSVMRIIRSSHVSRSV
jgi:hypothetical protein